MTTKDELAAMIAALESQPHLSIKEEKYLTVCKELFQWREWYGNLPYVIPEFEDDV